MLNFVLAVLAAYRLTVLLTYDDGPWDIFLKFRVWTDSTNGNGGFYKGLNDFIYCPYCVGVWMAFLCSLLVFEGVQSVTLGTFAIAGGQLILHKTFDEAR